MKSLFQHFIWSEDQIAQIQNEKIYLPESVLPVRHHQCPDTLEKRKFFRRQWADITLKPSVGLWLYVRNVFVIVLYFHLRDGEPKMSKSNKITLKF